MWSRDSKGRPLKTTYLAGTADEFEVNTTWHPLYRIPTQIVQPGLTEDMVYDANGLLTSYTATDTSGQGGGPNVRASSFTYQAGGLLQSVDGPLPGSGDTSSYSYTSDGYLASTTDANGHVTTFSNHNGRGQPQTITLPNGLQTTITYNSRGWVNTIAASDGATTRTTSFAYDEAGNVTRMTLPSGGYMDYVYEGNSWLTSATSSLGETITYTHDNMGNVTSQTVSGNTGVTFSMQATYDGLGRLLSTIGASGDITQYGYSKRDEIVSITDPTGQIWGTSFDGLGRLIRTVDPQGDQENLDVDTNGDVTAFEDGNTYTTQFVRNGIW